MRTLVLACGNSLRGDDGVGLVLARYAEEWAAGQRADVTVIARMQWTPELSGEIATAESVVFLDCEMDLAPGVIRVREVEPTLGAGMATHHLDAAELLRLTLDLYGRLPGRALLLTVGAACIELSEGLSAEVEAALPEARREINKILNAFPLR